MSERKRETEREREREGGVKQKCQNCIPTMNMNTLCSARFYLCSQIHCDDVGATGVGGFRALLQIENFVFFWFRLFGSIDKAT